MTFQSFRDIGLGLGIADRHLESLWARRPDLATTMTAAMVQQTLARWRRTWRYRLFARWLAVVLILGGASPAWGAITYVNSVGAFSLVSVGSLATVGTSHTTGNCLVVGVRINQSQSVSSVTDTAGNTYTQAATLLDGSGDRLAVWTATNITGNAANIVTATFSSSSTASWVSVDQYSGCATSSLVRTTATGSGSSGTTLTSGTFDSTCGDAHVVAGENASTSAAPYTAGTNYTIRQSNVGSGGFGGTEDRITTGDLTGTTAVMTSSFSVRWIIVVAVIKPATGCAATPGRSRGRTL